MNLHTNSSKALPGDSITVTSHFRFGFFDGGVWFFSDVAPYMGSMRRHGWTKEDSPEHRFAQWAWAVGSYDVGQNTFSDKRGEFEGRDTFGDFLGIYYRHFRWVGEATLWTLRVSLWYPVVLSGVLPAYWVFHHWRKCPKSVGAMTQYFPSLRGWVSLFLAACAFSCFPYLRPAIHIDSGVGTFLAEPVAPLVYITGAFLIFVCLLASVEAFRRGSRPDKVFACGSFLLTIGLMVQLCELFVLPVRH
jgi:hypothetical protein